MNQKISIVKKIVIIAFISLIIGLIFTNDLNPLGIERGGQEGLYPISNESDIEQQIILENTKSLHISLLKNISPEAEEWYHNHPKAGIEVELLQNGLSDSQFYSCAALENTWDLIDVKLNFGRFKNGLATVRLSSQNVPPEYGVAILLTSGVQNIPISNVVYNGETLEGMYCCLQYGFFPIKAYLISSALVFGFITTAYLLFNLISNTIKRYAVIYAFLAVLVIRYIINIGNTAKAIDLDSWITTPWIINYNDGFVSKALPGTIISLFTDYISKNTLNVIFHIIFITACIILCFAMKKMIDIAEDRKTGNADDLIYGVNFLMLAYAVGPLSLATYLRQWGRFDVILIGCFLISILILLRTDKPGLTYLVTGFSVIAILSHQIYIFVLYPAVFCIFLYLVFIRNEKRYVKPFLINLFVPAAFGFYVQFIGNIKMPLQRYLSILETRTDTPILSTMVDGEYYLSGTDNVYTFGTLDIHHFNDGLSLVMFVVLMVPIVSFLWRLWSATINHTAGTGIHIWKIRISEKLVYALIALIPFIAPVFMFFTISDYGRVMTMFACGETMMAVTLSLIDKEHFEKSMQGTIYYYKEKYGNWYFTGIIAYLVSLSTCTSLLIPEVLQGITADINNGMLSLVKLFLNIN